MSWASSRRTLILVIIGSVVTLIAAGIVIATFYKTPSCNDGVKNQDEEGVDCGGACLQICTPSVTQPVVSFVRELVQTGGRVDVIAYVENPNLSAAAKDIPYTVEMYDDAHELLATRTGKLDLPPATGVPVFIPNAFSGEQLVREAFLTFNADAYTWYRFEGELNIPQVEDVAITGTPEAPRVEAILRNSEPTSILNLKVVATVFDASDNAIAASQTIIAHLPGQGAQRAIFTWNAPFKSEPTRIDVRPIIDLP